ncbi:group 1 glycosyl transferase [Nostoc commune NIES-4072]|uniref:Group 1 glycosyl transferase n=1 Tax=Nostoc commune NIES-4072 TaxID=2005467 RepID=A0A2R5FM15_NOSCO|nr:glycosyltransferase [Nostoc commune]BBD69165.1 group 1 glycosyl transferase [Nostoc commune HK-02]GBG19837.1 group 1 glycosyl transferase [Nostoc commune NIES-4072]
MKILFIAPYIGAIYGGTSKMVTDLLEGIGRLGVTVDLVTTNANGSNTLDVPLNEWITRKYYRVQHFDCWYRDDFIISASLIKWLVSNINNYDIVHSQTVFSPMISVTHLICKYFHIPYIVTPHGMLEPWALSYKIWKKRIYYKLFENPSIKNSSAIQAMSSLELKNINSLQLQNTIFIPNGIHCKEFETLPTPEIFYQQFPKTRGKTLILFLGRIDPKKGLDLLAPAFAKVHNQFPDTHLVVAGPDNIGFMDKAQNYFLQAGCLDAVTFTGMVSGTLKYAALAAANLYVAPSYSEGFSISILEGMASGLPCIITTACNFPEAAKAQAAHVVEIDVNAIANALIECLSHPQQATEMGDRAREFIFQNYTWDRAAHKLIQVYKTVIDGKPLPEFLG